MGVISKFRRGIAVVTLLGTGVGFLASPYFGAAKLAFTYYDPFSIAEYRLRALSTDEYVEEIKEAIVEEDFDDARGIVEIGQEQGHHFDPELIAQTHQSSTEWTWHQMRDFGTGFAKGEVSNFTSLTGSIASDFVIFGDLRDVTFNGLSAVRGQEYDQLTLGLAVLGILTTAAPPIEIGVSTLKGANRAQKLGRGWDVNPALMRSLGRSARDLVDIKALKTAMSGLSSDFRIPTLPEFSKILSKASASSLTEFDFVAFQRATLDLVPIDIAALRRRFAGVLRSAPKEEISKFTTAAAEITAGANTKAVYRSLEKGENLDDLARFGKLANKARDRTPAIVRILGKNAIRLGELIYEVIVALMFIFTWIVGAVWSGAPFIINIRALLR